MDKSLSSGLLLLLGIAAGRGQTIDTATVTGIISDPSGAAVAGARIEVRNLTTGIRRSVTTTRTGLYALTALVPDQYSVEVEAKGFSAAAQRINLSVGQNARLDFALQIEARRESVQVSESAPAIDAGRTVLSQVIQRSDIEALPIASRNFVQFVQLTPKVLPASATASRGYLGERYRDTQFSFEGVRHQYNRETMDGANATVFMANAVKSFYSLESVQEFRVANSLYTAEQGHAAGGVVNVITRWGGSQWHGALYDYFQNNRLDAPDLLAPPGLRVLRRNQFGASGGGPAWRDKVYVFGNYEGQRQARSPTLPPVFVNSLDAINVALARLGFPQESIAVLPTVDSDQFLIRTDYVPGKRHRAMARYNFFNSNNRNDLIGNAGQLNDPITPLGAHDDHIRDQAFVANLYSFPSPTWTNNVGLGVDKHVFQSVPRPGVPPVELVVTGAFSTGTNVGQPSTSERRYHVFDNVTWIHGRHELKFGGEYMRANAALLNGPGSFAVIAGLQGLLAPQPVVLQLRLARWLFPQGWPKFHANQPCAYIEDQWKATDTLTLNLGLRYDLEQLSGLHTIVESGRGNLQPRFGFAWSPGSDRALVIRGGFGLFTADRYHALMAIDALQHGPGFPSFNDAFLNANPWARRYRPLPDTATTAVFSGQAAVDALIELGRTGSVSGGVPAQASTAAEDPALPNPYARQWGLEIERQFGSNLTITAGYSGLQGRRFPTFVNWNILPAVAKLPSGENDYQATGPNPRLYDPRFGSTFFVEPLGTSFYNSATLSIRKRFGERSGLGLNYVFSRNIDNYGSISNNGVPEDFYNIDNDRSVSSEHAKHRLALWLTLDTPRRLPAIGGFTLSFILTANSPRYYNVTAGTDLNHDGSPYNDRPDALGRNTFRGDDFMSLDMRIARKFRLNERLSVNLLAEFYNLLNRVNITDFSTVYGQPTLALPPTPTFSTPRAVGNPFQSQLGLRLVF